MKAKHFFLVLLGVNIFAAISACAQSTDDTAANVSRVQWANASAFGLKFTLQGEEVADPWRAGGQVSGAATATLDWRASFAPPPPLSQLNETFELKPGDNCVAVLIGDFAKIDLTSREKLPPGYTKLDDKTAIRAALVKFPIPKTATERDMPVYLVNGIPESTVKVSVDGAAPLEVKYGVPLGFKTQPAQFRKIKATTSGLDSEFGFLFEDGECGLVIAFYRPKAAAQAEFVLIGLQSMK